MKEAFHDSLVLGKWDVTSASDRLAVIDAVQQGHSESDGAKYDCFIPRHGLRVRQNGTQTDYVISFACLKMKRYSPNGAERLSITASAKRVLDEYLQKAGIAQAEPPH